MNEIYFDNSATTPICSAALEAYTEVSLHHAGNPSSRHFAGQDAAAVLRRAREEICRCLGGVGGELIFTASGSEADNLAIFGRAYAKARYRGGKILTTAGEHAAVEKPLARLREEGFHVVEIPTRGGALDMEALDKELTPDTVLATLMTVNNETGAVYDVAAAARKIHARCPEAAVHADATQSFMKLPLTAKSLGVDMLTASAHKIEGPKGVGALWISPAIIKNRGLLPRVLGGGQESGFRSGTENVPAIAAFAAACRYQRENFASFARKTAELREYLLSRITADPALAEVTPLLPAVAAPHILNLLLPAIRSETMLNALSARGICVSAGSACSSHDKRRSGALLAFGVAERQTNYSIRVSLSHNNEKEEIDVFCSALAEEVSRLQREK